MGSPGNSITESSKPALKVLGNSIQSQPDVLRRRYRQFHPRLRSRGRVTVIILHERV